MRRILAYGAAAGLIVGIPLSAWIVTGNSGHGIAAMAVTYLVMLVALSLIFVAVKRQRDEQGGGVIRFWPALGLGLGISLVAGIFYVAAFETACALTHYDFAADFANSQIEEARASGATAQALAALAADMAQFRAQFADPLFRLPMIFAEIFPVGLLVSLISAGLLRNPRFLPAPRARPGDTDEDAGPGEPAPLR